MERPVAGVFSNLLKALCFIAILALVAFVWPPSCLATSIVVIAQRDAVLIAADSKSTDLTLATKEAAPESYTCKIHIEKKFVFASSGCIRFADDKTVYFDVATLIRKISSGSSNVREIVDTFTEDVKQPLAKSINTLRKQNANLIPNGPALSTVFVTFDNEHSVIFSLNFRVRFELDRVFVDVDRRIVVPPEGQHSKLFLGVHEKMIEYDATYPNWASRDAIEGVKHLIGLEIEANPEKVGLPIDIFLLRANSSQWIQRKEQCPDT